MSENKTVTIQIDYSFRGHGWTSKEVKIPSTATRKDAETLLEQAKEDYLNGLHYEDVEGEHFCNESSLDFCKDNEQENQP